jgi:hypothetical protein
MLAERRSGGSASGDAATASVAAKPAQTASPRPGSSPRRSGSGTRRNAAANAALQNTSPRSMCPIRRGAKADTTTASATPASGPATGRRRPSGPKAAARARSAQAAHGATRKWAGLSVGEMAATACAIAAASGMWWEKTLP